MERSAGLSIFHRYVLYGLMLLVFILTFLRTAWISDDAAITLRTALNFVHGYGLVFNVEERVQGYTHPLWFLLVSALTWLQGNPYLSVHLLSFVSGVVTLILIIYAGRREFLQTLIALAALLFSKAFVDYSSSGLENPLAHVLIILAILTYLRALDGRAFADRAFFTVCSLAFLTRPDLILILMPFALHLCWFVWRRTSLRAIACSLLLGSLPALAWMLFSLVYYGYPFPNTAYAKLGAGIAADERISQAGLYFLDSLRRDPLTLGFILLFMLQALFGGRLLRLAAVSIGLYLLYVVSIGGDFMSGRFFTVPLVLSALIFVLEPIHRPVRVGMLGGVLILAGLGLNKTLLSGASYHDKTIGAGGIADERGYYFQLTGLIRQGAEPLPLPEWRLGRRDVKVQCGEMGFEGIKHGPSLHIIDPCALVDPLLARLPAQYDPSWRVGHLHRQLPTNYEKSIAQNKNLLIDPEVRGLYTQVQLLSRGELFSMARWRAIWALNTARGQQPWDFAFRYASIARDIDVPIVTLSAFEHPEGVRFKEAVEVAFPPGTGVYWLDVVVDGQSYEVSLLINGAYVSAVVIPEDSLFDGKERKVRIQLDEPMRTSRMLMIGRGSGDYLLSGVWLNQS